MMVMTDSYHTNMVAPELETGRLAHAATTTVVKSGSIPESLPVTMEEEEAWLNKLRDLAGITA